MKVISCRTAFGQGGLGQHFAQLVEETRAANQLTAYYAHTLKEGDSAVGRTVDYVRLARAKRYTPLRFFPAYVSYVGECIFDKRVAAVLKGPGNIFMGFVGKSLYSFREAKRSGFKRLELVAANSHVNNVRRLHHLAARDSGVKDTWMSEALAEKTLKEYKQADLIYTHSEYTRQSFIDGGIDPQKIRKTYLNVNPRFVPPMTKPSDGIFRVVYVGRLDATKGIPLLLKAFSRLPIKDALLTLVGGWSSRVMKKHVQTYQRYDKRIQVAPGDPLPVLQEADVLVHPSYEDGFAYAPMEALACGVPVIVTQDTGMKEHVAEGINGYVTATGSCDQLIERMEYIARRPLAKVAGEYTQRSVNLAEQTS